MPLFAISDLHLSFQVEKPMDIFGTNWRNHHKKIAHYWHKYVGPEDTVIIGGDISWGMKLEEAKADLKFLGELPGKKVIIKGNHDYWWESYSKVKKYLPTHITALQNNYYPFDPQMGIAICGTRGWQFPGQSKDSDIEHDKKIFNRELHRLELSLASAWKAGFTKPIVAVHFPPLKNGMPEPMILNLMQNYNVKICLYGHLHGKDHIYAFTGNMDEVYFYFTSSDYLNFIPKKIDLSLITTVNHR